MLKSKRLRLSELRLPLNLLPNNLRTNKDLWKFKPKKDRIKLRKLLMPKRRDKKIKPTNLRFWLKDLPNNKKKMKRNKSNWKNKIELSFSKREKLMTWLSDKRSKLKP